MTEEPKGNYLYCLGEGEARKEFGNIGIQGERVYAVSVDGLVAVLHDCQLKPYDSSDLAKVKEWLKAHNRVIELAMTEFNAVLPFRFSTIFKPRNSMNALQSLARWMKEENGPLKQKLKRTAGKKEYGVQIFADTNFLGKKIRGFQTLEERAKASGRGTAFLYRQKRDRLLANNASTIVASWFKEFYELIKKCCDDLKILETRRAEANAEVNLHFEEARVIIANFACLVNEENLHKLAGELESIQGRGFTARLTGPWPPYNFV